MVDYFGDFDAEDRLYGNHRVAHRPTPRPHPYDEKREADRRIASRWCMHPSGCTGKPEWFDENGVGFCGEHAK
jgi:hypothetical protein